MEFTFPNDSEMFKIYNLIKKFYDNEFFNFSKHLDKVFFNIVTEDKNYLVLIGTDEHSISIFNNSESLLGCHFMMTQDMLNTRTYGLNSIVIEESPFEVIPTNFQSFIKKYKHYQIDNKYIYYKKINPGEEGRIINNLEAKEIVFILEKLLLIQEHIVENDLFEDYDEPMVSTAHFSKNSDCLHLLFTPLGEFEILDSEFSFLIDNYEFEISETEVHSGELYIGHVYAVEPIEVYDKIEGLEIPLVPIILYGIDDQGEMNHLLYTTPFESREASFITAINHYFNQFKLYDTIISDNMFVCEMLTEPLKKLGIEVLYRPGNPYNYFISNYFIEITEVEGDVEMIDEILEDNKSDIRIMFGDKERVLSQFSEIVYDKVDENEEAESEDFLEVEKSYIS